MLFFYCGIQVSWHPGHLGLSLMDRWVCLEPASSLGTASGTLEKASKLGCDPATSPCPCHSRGELAIVGLCHTLTLAGSKLFQLLQSGSKRMSTSSVLSFVYFYYYFAFCWLVLLSYLGNVSHFNISCSERAAKPRDAQSLAHQWRGAATDEQFGFCLWFEHQLDLTKEGLHSVSGEARPTGLCLLLWF